MITNSPFKIANLIISTYYLIKVEYKEYGFRYKIWQQSKGSKDSKLILEWQKSDLERVILNSKYPVVIVVAGDEVLNKRIDSKNHKNIQLSNVFSTEYPNINIISFYTCLNLRDGDSVLSMIRKEKLDSFLDKLMQMGLEVIEIFFHESSNYKSVIFDKTRETQTNYAKLLKRNMNKWIQKMTVEFILKRTPIILFCALIVNFAFYLFFHHENTKLNKEIMGNQPALIKLDKLKNEFSELTVLKNKSPYPTLHILVFFTDQLAANVPKEIKLNRMEFFPIGKNEREKTNNRVLIKGICENPIEFSNWVTILKKNKWISDIDNQLFQVNPQSGSSSFELTLKITYE